EQIGIQPAKVRHQEFTRLRFVELEKGDVPAVRAPLPSVAKAELFLVHPIRGTIDDRPFGAVDGELLFFPAPQVHQEKVTIAHEGDVATVRADLGKHLVALITLAYRRDYIRLEVVDVVVALGIHPPDALSIGEEEDFFAVRAV